MRGIECLDVSQGWCLEIWSLTGLERDVKVEEVR
jgi:hypothetical protein